MAQRVRIVRSAVVKVIQSNSLLKKSRIEFFLNRGYRGNEIIFIDDENEQLLSEIFDWIKNDKNNLFKILNQDT